MSLKSRPKLLVLNPFPIYPPVSGGQGRVFHLYKHIALTCEVVILCFADRRSSKLLAPGLQLIQVPKSIAQGNMETALFLELGFPTCAIMPKAAALTPEYAYRAKQYAKDAEIVILSHPYLFQQALGLDGHFALVYDAHNVEYELQSQILPAELHYLLAEVQQAEAAACKHSRLIAACSQADAEKLASLYAVSPQKIIIVPNGADTTMVPFVPFALKQRLKSAAKLLRPRTIYMGSNFPPNIQAAKQVIKIAQQLPEVDFLLLGSLCAAFKQQDLPDNVTLLGVVSEQEKQRLFGLTDIALNPVESGSGTNLKMLEYMAAGIPVITTAHGARGIGAEPGRHCIISDCHDMPRQILTLLNADALAASLAEEAYLLTKTRFEWQQIAAAFAQQLLNLIPGSEERQ